MELKIIAIGDPHNTLPSRLISIIKKEKPNLILCTGDLGRNRELRKLVFENWKELQKEGKDLASIVGKERIKKLEINESKSTRKVLEQLNSFGIPVIIVHGNSDNTPKYPFYHYIAGETLEKITAKLKYVTLIDYQAVRFHDYLIYGWGCKFAAISENKYVKEHKNKVFKFMKKHNGKKIILLTHEPPKDTRLDRIGKITSPRYGQNIGDPILRDAIETFKPVVTICGHIHETVGMTRLNNVKIVNCGSHGQYAIITIQNNVPTVKLYLD